MKQHAVYPILPTQNMKGMIIVSFTEEMKKLGEQYDEEFAHKDDKDIESYIAQLKRLIKANISRGEKTIYYDDWFCFSTGKSEDVVFNVHRGLLKTTLKWSLTPKMQDKLEKFRNAAANEGIIISGFSFGLGYGSGDDACSFNDRFYEDHGEMRIGGGERDWHLFVLCSFRFSI